MVSFALVFALTSSAVTVMFLTGMREIAVIQFSGLPDRPKPPAIKVMPSNSTPSGHDSRSALPGSSAAM